MKTAIEAFLLVYAGLFPVVNPVGNAPIFLALTANRSVEVQGKLAAQVALNGLLLLLGALFVGSYVLFFFGITVPVLRIAGGLAVAAFGWRVLSDGGASSHEVEATEGTVEAFYPLTLPLTVGPGSISVAIALGTQRPRILDDFQAGLTAGLGAIAGLIAISFTVFVCYRFAGRMVGVLGSGGINVLTRMSGFFLLCIGIQIIWGGVSALTGLPE